MRNIRHFSWLALLNAFALALLFGCQPAGSVRVDAWAAPSDELVLADSARQGSNEVFTENGNRISLRAAVNETAAFQLILRNSGQPTAIASITCSDLASAEYSISNAIIKSYIAHYVVVDTYPAWYYQRTPYRRATREFPDILVPTDPAAKALPAEVTSNRNTLVWFDLHIPPGTRSGQYTGRIEVRTTDNQTLQFPLNLEVWPFALPDVTHVTAIAPVSWLTLVSNHIEVGGKPYRPQRLALDDPQRGAELPLLDATFRLFREHRCHAVLTDLYPQRTLTPEGQIEIDWADYDSTVSAYLDGSAFEDRIPIPAWPLPVDERFPPPELFGGPATPGYAAAQKKLVESSLSHFREKGWLDRHIVFVNRPGSSRGDEYAAFREASERILSSSKSLRLWCELPEHPLTHIGWEGHPFVDLSKMVGLWCPPARYAKASTSSQTRPTSGPWQWWQPDQPPFSGSLAVVSPPTDVGSVAHQAYRWGSGAVWLTGAADWPADPSANMAATVKAETNWLIYPGKPYGLTGPIPSIRLKHLQRGLQDIEYLWLLRQQRRPAVAEIIGGSLFAFGGSDARGDNYLDGRAYGWCQDPVMWRLGRELMAAELVQAASGKPAEDFEQFRQRLDWQRFLLATRKAVGWVDGIRLRGSLAGDSIRAEACVSALNLTTKGIRAKATCTPAPTGWRVQEPEPAFSTTPGSLERHTLTLKTNDLRASFIEKDGVMNLPIRLAAEDGSTIDAPARLALLRARRFPRPPTIDGRLEDWPPGMENTAGDFVLVGGSDVPKAESTQADRPGEPTFVFVGYDDQAIYIAFNCAESQSDQRDVARTNYVRYEGMTPVGEDLVEVLLDPAAVAATSGDLYHLVVKANGAVIAERGIGTRTPIGAHSPWTADVEVGVDAKSTPGRWFVEIRLGWSSFGKDIRRDAVWGVNFARLQNRTGEYSTWSGARWNVYSPGTLGNLCFLP